MCHGRRYRPRVSRTEAAAWREWCATVAGAEEAWIVLPPPVVHAAPP